VETPPWGAWGVLELWLDWFDWVWLDWVWFDWVDRFDWVVDPDPVVAVVAWLVPVLEETWEWRARPPVTPTTPSTPAAARLAVPTRTLSRAVRRSVVLTVFSFRGRFSPTGTTVPPQDVGSLRASSEPALSPVAERAQRIL
jgi:hypothetical protein